MIPQNPILCFFGEQMLTAIILKQKKILANKAQDPLVHPLSEATVSLPTCCPPLILIGDPWIP